MNLAIIGKMKINHRDPKVNENFPPLQGEGQGGDGIIFA